MTDNSSDPLAPSNLFFSVQFDEDISATFQEVEILNSHIQSIEYRHGNTPIFSPINWPGLGKVGNLVLRKGNLINAARFWDWYKEIKLKKIKADHITVHLMNEEGARKMTWTLNQAWPTKVSDPGELLDGEAGVESMEIAFERLVVDVL
jgi:phage tail-like protein